MKLKDFLPLIDVNANEADITIMTENEDYEVSSNMTLPDADKSVMDMTVVSIDIYAKDHSSTPGPYIEIYVK